MGKSNFSTFILDADTCFKMQCRVWAAKKASLYNEGFFSKQNGVLVGGCFVRVTFSFHQIGVK